MEQTKIREQVIDDLKQYPELKKKVILLRYEQEHPAKISDSEVIDSMALSRPVSDGIRPAGFISDKTMRIATQFRDKKDRLNQETIMEIAQELYTVEQQISKLEFYVSQLEEKQAEVIRKYYFEGKTWGELQRENASGAADTAQAQRRWPGCACVHLLLHRAGERRSKEYMTVHFYDDAHEAFFREKLERGRSIRAYSRQLFSFFPLSVRAVPRYQEPLPSFI